MFKVCEHFYPQPDLIRDLALRSQFYEPKHYAGYRSRQSYITPDIIERIKTAFGFTDITLHNRRDRSGHFYTSADRGLHRTGFFAHYDLPYHPERAAFSLVVYLSPDAPPEGGTCLLRHLPTGISRYPTVAIARSLGLSRAALIRRLDDDSSDRRKWQELASVDNVYNRAVLFPAYDYHASRREFGRHVGQAKLHQAFFFYGSPNPCEP